MELTDNLCGFLRWMVGKDLTHLLGGETFLVVSCNGNKVTFNKPFNILNTNGFAVLDSGICRVADSGEDPYEVVADKPIPVGEKVRIVFFEYFRQGKGIPLVQRGRPKAMNVGQILTNATKDGQWGSYWPDEIKQGV